MLALRIFYYHAVPGCHLDYITKHNAGSVAALLRFDNPARDKTIKGPAGSLYGFLWGRTDISH